LTLEGVDDVEGGDGLSLGVLGVGDGVTDDVLEENLQDTTGLFVDQTRDTLDTTSSSQSTDGWLGDPLDVVPQDLSVTLGAAFAESFTSFTTSRHVVCICELLFLARLTEVQKRFGSNIPTELGLLFGSNIPTELVLLFASRFRLCFGWRFWWIF
jgi:hypothetical protein